MLTLVPLNPGTPASPGDPCSIQRSKVTTLNHSSQSNTRGHNDPSRWMCSLPVREVVMINTHSQHQHLSTNQQSPPQQLN